LTIRQAGFTAGTDELPELNLLIKETALMRNPGDDREDACGTTQCCRLWSDLQMNYHAHVN